MDDNTAFYSALSLVGGEALARYDVWHQDNLRQYPAIFIGQFVRMRTEWLLGDPEWSVALMAVKLRDGT